MGKTSGRSDLIELALIKRMDREKSIAVSHGEVDDEGKEILIFLPKSLVEDNGDGTFTMPEWLAKEKELI